MKPESAIQRGVVRLLALRGYECAAVPNGAHLAGDKVARFKQIAAMKADGMHPGFIDLIVWGKQGRVGFIEVKTPKGSVSQEQRNCRAKLERDGHHYAIVRDVSEVGQVLVDWGWP